MGISKSPDSRVVPSNLQEEYSADNQPSSGVGQCQRPPSEKERGELRKLYSEIRRRNLEVPELRLEIPRLSWSHSFYLTVDLDVCSDYYSLCEGLRYEDDAAQKIADLLAEFADKHPREWHLCGWKNDFIARLMLGQTEGTSRNAKQAAERWWKRYWTKQQEIDRKIDKSISPKRMAASTAAREMRFLFMADENPEIWSGPGFKEYARVVRWLNRNRGKLANKMKGQALNSALLSRYRARDASSPLNEYELGELCSAYEGIESSYPPGEVPASQVVLALFARRNGVSPRLVSEVRAENQARS